ATAGSGEQFDEPSTGPGDRLNNCDAVRSLHRLLLQLPLTPARSALYIPDSSVSKDVRGEGLQPLTGSVPCGNQPGGQDHGSERFLRHSSFSRLSKKVSTQKDYTNTRILHRPQKKTVD